MERKEKEYKVCFLSTIITNDYNKTDKPGKFEKLESFDYFLITNLKDISNIDTSWDIIQINDDYLEKKCNGITNNIYKSRYIKFMGYSFIEENIDKRYDCVFYCDALYAPNNNIKWKKYIERIIKSKSGLLQKLHPIKPHVYTECDNCILAKKDTKENMNNMKKFLLENNMPDTLIIKENTTFGYDPNNPNIRLAFNDFWKHYTINQITYRDQPLWLYIYWKHNLEAILEENLHSMFSKEDKLLFKYVGSFENRSRTYTN